MDEPTDSAMIALLPMVSDWCKLDLPHLTLVYAGKVSDLKPTDQNKMAKDAASIAMLSRPITLQVLSRELFGNWSQDPQDACDVYRLRASSELMAMRNTVEQWNQSEFPFNPHVTIGPPGAQVDTAPTYIAFDRICVAWGGDVLTFRLNRGM